MPDRVLALLALIAASSLWGCGGPTDAAGSGHDAEVAELTRISDSWDKAIVAKDEAAIAANMTEDFRQIDGDGALQTRKSFVMGIVDPRLTIDPYSVEEFSVRLYGDTALLSGRTHMNGSYDGKPFTTNYRYIDIYVRRNGAWKIASVQITRLRP